MDGKLVAVNTVNVLVTLSANGNTYTLRDVGADVAKVLKDGTFQLAIVGQVPFGFTGVLKIDPARKRSRTSRATTPRTRSRRRAPRSPEPYVRPRETGI